MPAPTNSGPLTPTVFHVLLALSGGALHGYGIMKRVEVDSGIEMGPGTVYGSLQRLTEAGWIAEAADGDSSDRRRGRTFELTSAGEAALRAEAARITRLAHMEPVQRLATDGALS